MIAKSRIGNPTRRYLMTFLSGTLLKWPLVLKKTSNPFGKPFAIIKRENLDLETWTHNQNLELIYCRLQNPDFRSKYLIAEPGTGNQDQTAKLSCIELNIKYSKKQ